MSQFDDSVRFVDGVLVRGRVSISSLRASCAFSNRRGDITTPLGVSYRHFGRALPWFCNLEAAKVRNEEPEGSRTNDILRPLVP